MARRSRPSTPDLERDDPDPIASLLSPVAPAPLLSPSYFSTPEVESFLSEIEDRRTYHPDGFFRPALTTPATSSSLKSNLRPGGRFPSIPAFDHPRQVIVCVRRKQRREVIFAKRKHRKGAGARRRRRNFMSEVKC